MRTTFVIGVIFAFLAVLAAGDNPPAARIAMIFAIGLLSVSGGIGLTKWMMGE